MPLLRSTLIVLLSLAAACGGPGSPTPTTGLTGTVVRGPITPVCQPQVACDAPFSAGFTVERNGRQIAQFRSAADGTFTVWLSPGTYNVIPDADAPLLAPMSQLKTADVGTVGLTTVRLQFDTGIR
ncbi:MAG TPA: hypothetical protein VEL79_19915 [Vicinamibacterales bacterium]|nr:hypothetical protein [Vicinamibacterales bacterium]